MTVTVTKNPLHAKYYADHAIQRSAEITENVRVARDTFRIRLHCPEIARSITPGQFLMLRLANWNDPLIGRPLALYDVVLRDGEPVAVDVVYLVKGKFTSKLAQFATGLSIEVWGPLGNGFLPCETDHLIMVAGGIGQTPFLALAQENLGHRRYGIPPRTVRQTSRVTLCYGARSADYLAGIDDFARLGVSVQIATDDGSRGHHGFVTELLEQILTRPESNRRIVTCGPEAMMEAVSKIAARAQTPCEVSLETPMACGVGICFTCVAKIRDDSGSWDYKRTCVEGPVFDAAMVEW